MKKIITLFFILVSLTLFSQKKKKDSIPKWKVNGKMAFLFNQSSFSNWVSGGENTIAGNINVNYDFNYRLKNVNWDSRIISSYGLSHLSEKGLRKTSDRFELNSLLGIKSQKLWFFSFFTNFKTQFSTGYNYKKDPKVEVSDLFSPAYLSFGPGMLWKKSNFLHFNIAPATSRFTFVNDDFTGKFGVEEGDNTAFGLGFNFSLFSKFEAMENVQIENILAVYSDYLDNPENIDIDYRTNMLFKVNEFISMNITLHTIIDDSASSKIQFSQLFGLGFNYNFHEKVTY
ncbi:DUF3078 domain-containing protein [Polaribacter sp.]|uniref:DUF3078 domain-containing protein n=1 Tax=Polaribacter sp. TaxID=1920175 RepID=UPI003EF9DA11